MYNCPIEYPFIVAQAKANGPSADFIEAMSYRCDNPWFRTIEFREALIEYRKYRLRGEKVSVSAADRIKILEGNRSLLQEMSRHS